VGDIGAPELVIIGIIIVLLFGATRLPATAKGLGQALRLFKKEIRADDEPATPAATAPAATAPAEITAVREQQAPPATESAAVEPQGVVTR
jgi:sec-independent protein translocase protein TatA